MVKEKVNMARQQVLEQENIILREKLATQERLQAEQRLVLGGDIASEIRKIRQKGKSTSNSITVVEQNDHKNISLWTRDGDRIGPMHPDNAIQALNRFADIGIMLTADRPTAEQIEAYKQTPEYKKLQKAEDERRAIKMKSKKSGQIERLSAEIAKMSGTTVEAINHILRASEVGKK